LAASETAIGKVTTLKGGTSKITIHKSAFFKLSPGAEQVLQIDLLKRLFKILLLAFYTAQDNLD
jgi:hypothetical protein